jgi:hypothetical protein
MVRDAAQFLTDRDTPLSRLPVFSSLKDLTPPSPPLTRKQAIEVRRKLQDPDKFGEVVIDILPIETPRGAVFTHERTTASVIDEETFSVRVRSDFLSAFGDPTYEAWQRSLERLQRYVDSKGLSADLRMTREKKAMILTAYRGRQEHAVRMSAYPNDQHFSTELVLNNTWDDVYYPSYKGRAPRFVSDVVQYGSFIKTLTQFK